PAAVVQGVVRTVVRDAFDGAQPLQLGEREVLGEPAGDGHAVQGLGGAPAGELGVVGDVRRAADLRFVAADQMAVPGGDQVAGLDDVSAQVEGELDRKSIVVENQI